MSYFKWRIIMVGEDLRTPYLATWRVNLDYYRRRWPETIEENERGLIAFIGEEIVPNCSTRGTAEARVRYVINRMRKL